MKTWMVALVIALCMAGCQSPTPNTVDNPTRIAIEVDSADPERLLRFYFGGYGSESGQDPFEAGLVTKEGGSYYLDLAQLTAAVPILAAQLEGRSEMDDDALQAFWQATYYEARSIPPSLEAFLRVEADSSIEWFEVEVQGVMTQARRRIRVPAEAVRAALFAYKEAGEHLLYPVGTTFIGEHLEADTVLETTVMRKRGDGFWDFATYDASGSLVPATAARPRALKSPTQCVGCHFGTRMFEPEKSFPGEASPGPHGPRELHVPMALRNSTITRFFDEHRKRSDTILGLYATLFVSERIVQRSEGTLSANDAALLDSLGL